MNTKVAKFGAYLVKVQKDGSITIYYVWGTRTKEVFKEGLTPYQALVMFRDCYLRKGEAYEAAKEFLLPLIANEF